MATIDCFDIDEVATRVIPNMAFALIDKEKYATLSPHNKLFLTLALSRLVRDQAFKAMQLFVKKLEDHVATMVSPAAAATCFSD